MNGDKCVVVSIYSLLDHSLISAARLQELIPCDAFGRLHMTVAATHDEYQVLSGQAFSNIMSLIFSNTV